MSTQSVGCDMRGNPTVVKPYLTQLSTRGFWVFTFFRELKTGMQFQDGLKSSEVIRSEKSRFTSEVQSSLGFELDAEVSIV